MNKPTATRKAGIIEKLDFAEAERLALHHALFETYANDSELPRFVSQRAESVLSNARECFDYLGQDLFEHLLLPHASTKLRGQHEAGKLRFYFPFFKGQLEQKQFGLLEFKTVNRPVYDELVRFVDGMDAKAMLHNTLFRRDKFRAIQQMVNDKKHGNVLRYEARHEGARFTGGTMPNGQLVQAVLSTPEVGGPAFDVFVPNGTPSKPVPSFRFVTGGDDVNKLCLFAVHATRIVMDVFYDQFFAPTDRVVNSQVPLPGGPYPARATFEVVWADPQSYP